MGITINQALSELFELHRVVFWYDEKGEMEEEYNQVSIDSVEKRKLLNNELATKYHIQYEKPHQKFLIYSPEAQPPDLENWLLDLNLAHILFHSDLASLYAQELDISHAYHDLIQMHIDYFKAKDRRERLSKYLKEGDTPNGIRLKMIAALLRTEADFTEIILGIASEILDEPQKTYQEIERYGLAAFFWGEIQRRFDYPNAFVPNEEKESAVTPKDFFWDLFKAFLRNDLEEEDPVQTLFRRWKDSNSYETVFRQLSEYFEEELHVEEEVQKISLFEMGNRDTFKIMDQWVIIKLIEAIINQSITNTLLKDCLRNRELSFWYKDFHHEYKVIELAYVLSQKINSFQIPYSIEDSLVKLYESNWFLIDQLYRKLIFHFQSSPHNSLLNKLVEFVEVKYLSDYLTPLQAAWDKELDEYPHWPPPHFSAQSFFSSKHLDSYLEEGKKVMVIISDGFRYEVAREFKQKLKHEKSLKATLSSMLTGIPSVTKWGMARLLPHNDLNYDIEKDKVLIDQQTSVTTKDRGKILQAAFDVPTKAMKLTAFLKLTTKEEIRELIRSTQLLYLYHNRIDQAGEQRETEEDVCKIVEESFKELIQCIKKFHNNGGSSILLVSDHGFLYQYCGLSEADIVIPKSNDGIFKKDQRYIIGRNLVSSPSTRIYNSGQLGIKGSWQVMIPRGIHRFPSQGTKRYVHGGGSLQEVLIPVLHIRKSRIQEYLPVEVDLIGRHGVITTNHIKVALYQREAISENRLARTLKVGFYSPEGEPISNLQELTFDSHETESRLREQKVPFTLHPETDHLRGKQIHFIMKEPIKGTSKWKVYDKINYDFKLSITRDFDF